MTQLLSSEEGTEELTTGRRSELLVKFPDAQWDEQRRLQLDRLKTAWGAANKSRTEHLVSYSLQRL